MMDHLLKSLKIQINEGLYIKDPETSDLGKRIVKESILLIDEIGFEHFTFKKLGVKIASNESSIYRYFENKHKLLLYLTSWHWGWLECQLVFGTNNMPNVKEKLKKAIKIVTWPVKFDATYSHIDEVKLNNIVVNEYSKSYLTKEVDSENREGYFAIYKRLINRLSSMILEVDESYPFPKSLASNVLEGSLHQRFLKSHFPSLTNCSEKQGPNSFFDDLVFKSLNI